MLIFFIISINFDVSAASSPSDTVVQLPDYIVKPRKQKYSKRNNPAVDLMQRIRNRRDLNNPYSQPFYSYDRYEKINLGLNNVSVDTTSRKKQFGFMADYIDTAAITGLNIVNLSVKEKTARELYRRDPEKRMQLVRGYRSEGIDDIFTAENIQTFLEDVLREIDIYQNDITLMQNRFVSPLSKIGVDYYMYFITDSLEIDGMPVTELTFVPKNAQSMGFNGKLYVDRNDSNAFIRRIQMRVPSAINLNFVNNLFVEQEFERDSLGNRHKVRDEMAVELQLIQGTPELYAHRLTLNNNFSYTEDPEFSEYLNRIGNVYKTEDADSRDEDFWVKTRQQALTHQEARVSDMLKELRGNKLYYWTERIVHRLAVGYWQTGKESKVDIGPINTMISSNSVEGLRLRVGAMTTAYLSPHWFARGYVAYGCKDHKWKYRAELEYAFNKKKYHSREFPIQSIRAEYQYDMDMIGQHYLFTNADNIFLSIKRKASTLMTYRRLMQLQYTMELPNGFSVELSARQEKQQSTPWMPFVNGRGGVFSSFVQSAFKIQLRYAPGETFYQMASMRLPINMDAWIFQLTHEFGPRGMLGASFTLNKTEFSMQKRLWFSTFGYLDVIAKAAKIWSQVQFTSLAWQNANLSYTIQPESYALLNPMEFALDYYGSLDLTYWGNGILFNRIPWVNKARLREVVSFRGFYGGLTRRNNPQYNEQLFRFPADADVGLLGHKPYMEISAGLDNIFSILRIDYVWRLSYRNKPGCDNSGLRVALHFAF